MIRFSKIIINQSKEIIMQQKIPILIISMKKSSRIVFLEARMKELELKFHIISGVNGVNYERKKKIDIISDQKKIFKNIGRKMSASEIGAAASHLKAYRYIIRNNFSQCIIMEDDAFPSVLLKEWAYSNSEVANKEILSFYSYANGFVYKKVSRKVLNKINIHKSKTHLFNNSCYQININTCKKIIELNNGIVKNIADWPINLENNKINLYVTIPFIALIDDKNISHLREERNAIMKNIFFNCKKKIPLAFLKAIRNIYTLFLVKFFIGSHGNFSNYNEQYLKKSMCSIMNFFNRKYFDMSEAYYKKEFYTEDLIKNCESFFINLKSQK